MAPELRVETLKIFALKLLILQHHERAPELHAAGAAVGGPALEQGFDFFEAFGL
jgi:hypothetical protein